MKKLWKSLCRRIVQNLIMIPVGVLLSLHGWHLENWQTWAFFVVCSILLAVQYNSIRNETLENLEKQLEH